jgi:hypothetical protein
MIRYHGNDRVKVGFYWSPRHWEIVTVPRGGGRLPGERGLRYYHLPLPLVILVGPMIGALYVIFLPLIGFALTFGFAAKKCLPIVRRAAAWVMVKMERSPGENG